MNVLPTIYFMLVFSLLSLGLSFRIEERARSLVPDRVQNTIVQLALAQHRHISDPANPNAGSYAGDIAELAATPYLPLWENDPDFSFPDTTPPASPSAITRTITRKPGASPPGWAPSPPFPAAR